MKTGTWESVLHVHDLTFISGGGVGGGGGVRCSCMNL